VIPGAARGRLNAKVAIITGAGQGIGRGIALALAKEGAYVAAVGRTAVKVEKVAAEIAELGGMAKAVACDVSERSAVHDMVADVVGAWGTVDIVINNAQDSVQRMFEETTDDDIDRAYRTGPLATVYVMQACLPHLKRRGGSVVNFGSSTAITGATTFSAYAMAKEAIRGLTRVTSRELGPYGIRVNAVCPAVLSPSAEQWANEQPERFERVLKSIPLGRMGDAEADIGRAVVALVSDDLQYVTGSTLILEGGRVILG
jgi:2-hydroxycyclohexanecarboxyl-CoA dehydrogenase